MYTTKGSGRLVFCRSGPISSGPTNTQSNTLSAVYVTGFPASFGVAEPETTFWSIWQASALSGPVLCNRAISMHSANCSR